MKKRVVVTKVKTLSLTQEIVYLGLGESITISSNVVSIGDGKCRIIQLSQDQLANTYDS